jgi:hypothetical protein
LDARKGVDAGVNELGLSKTRILEAVASQPASTKDVFLRFDYTNVREELLISPSLRFSGDHDLSSTPVADGYDPKKLESMYQYVVTGAENFLSSMRKGGVEEDSVEKLFLLLDSGRRILENLSNFFVDSQESIKGSLQMREQSLERRA